MKATIYHNTGCSKSRATLALLESQGVEFQIIEYLITPPSGDTLKTLANKLGIRIKDLVRTGEPEFKEANIDLDTVTDEQILQLLDKHPKLMQRPIVEVAQGARIGRPPESILDDLELNALTLKERQRRRRDFEHEWHLCGRD